MGFRDSSQARMQEEAYYYYFFALQEGHEAYLASDGQSLLGLVWV